MKFALTSLNRFILAGLLASVGASAAMAQAPAAAPAPVAAPAAKAGHGGEHMMDRQDPAKMQVWVAKRQADLKARLKITAAQEADWSRYLAAMQPPAHQARPTPEQRAELNKLTTPERIEKMQALRAQRMSEITVSMDKRDQATKAFYAILSPEQKKTFDAEHTRTNPHGEHPNGAMQPKS